jgi:putative phosphoesterase
MRIAAIYDIHGNTPAIEAVLDVISKKNVDAIVIGGDVVSGPFPRETLNLLQKIRVPTYFILGNAESDVIRLILGQPSNGMSEKANEVANWAVDQLTSEQKDFLLTWRNKLQLELVPGCSAYFCHGTPRSNEEIFTLVTPEEKVSDIFRRGDSSVYICGHTHMQFKRTINNIRIINAGSVGMPFGGTGADWLLINGNEFEFVHTEYNLLSAAERMRTSSYPDVEDFIQNNVIHSPTKNKMIDVLTKMEAHQQEKN